MFFCWVESHPTFVGGIISLLLGLAAIGAGCLAYFGAKSQADAAERHTKLQEHLDKKHTKDQETAYVMAVGIEIIEFISFLVIIRQSIDTSLALRTQHSRVLQHPTVFKSNPSAIAFFPSSCAHLVVRFYSMVNVAGIALEEATKHLKTGEIVQLSREDADFEIEKIATVVKAGLRVIDQIAPNYDLLPDYDDWKASTLKRCPVDLD